MDPEAVLAQLRATAGHVVATMDDGEYTDEQRLAIIAPHAEVLAEFFLALDRWLLAGGFPPAAWDSSLTR